MMTKTKVRSAPEESHDRRAIRIGKRLARALRWIGNARSRDTSRPVLKTFFVLNDSHPFGEGVVAATDGFRIHFIRGLRATAEEIAEGLASEAPWRFREKLEVDPGNYEAWLPIQASDHINDFEVMESKAPAMDAIMPSLDKKLECFCILHINPRFVREIADDVKSMRAMTIRVFRPKDPNDSKAAKDMRRTLLPIEFITRANDEDGMERMSIVMPMFHESWRGKDEEVVWPIAGDEVVESKKEPDVAGGADQS
jgi:hypothetical protein